MARDWMFVGTSSGRNYYLGGVMEGWSPATTAIWDIFGSTKNYYGQMNHRDGSVHRNWIIGSFNRS